jgi:hypothetical protein
MIQRLFRFLNPPLSYPSRLGRQRIWELQRRDLWYGYRPLFGWDRWDGTLTVELLWWRYITPTDETAWHGTDVLQRRILGVVPKLYKTISTGS